MKTTIQEINGAFVATLDGRLDTAVAAQTQQELQPLFEHSQSDVVLDCSRLQYISSSGLRIFLALAKRCPKLRITEANSDVYQVLEMTGFTKIMNVQRGMRCLSVDGCEVIGHGGVGIVYRLDADTIIKVFRKGTTLDEVRTEITMAKEAFVLGMPTAISFDIVRVGQQLGLVYELLRADTLSACLRREPQRVDELARLYANLFRQLHAIRVPRGKTIPDALVRERESVQHIRRYFDAEGIDILLRVIDAIPACDRLLHCDLQTKNAMLQGDELMLIDMGEVGYGHPVIDLAHSYSAMMTLVGDYETIIGVSKELAQDIWQRMIRYYFEGQPQHVIDHRLEQIKAVSTVRKFSWLSLSDSFPDEVIRQCQQIFEEQVTRQKEHLLEVCGTLNDWEV